MADQILTNVQSLREIISAEYCEKCKVRIKDSGRKWCKRCQDRYHRYLTSNQTKEKIILSQVSERYIGANLEHLSREAKVVVIDTDIFLYGGVGTGKTYAMAAMIREGVYQGLDCKKISLDEFCVQIRSCYAPMSKQTEWDYIKPLIDCDILFIDDLGLRTKDESDFAYVTLYTLLNKRQEMMLPTVISSNKNLEQIEKSFDSRIASRLKLAKVIKFEGKDRREQSAERK